MQRVCLDKTLNLTRAIMNRDLQVPDFIKVQRVYSPMDSFSFINSDVELPIEHLGLAVLSYQNAVEQFNFTRIDKDEKTGERTETQEFESLIGTGAHISDFLRSLSADSLNWYFNQNGMLKFQFVSNTVPFKNTSDFHQCKLYDEAGQDIRELAVTEAYHQAVKGYVAETMEEKGDTSDESFIKDLHDFMSEDAQNFAETMEQIKIASAQLVINQTKDNKGDFSAVYDVNSVANANNMTTEQEN